MSINYQQAVLWPGCLSGSPDPSCTPAYSQNSIEACESGNPAAGVQNEYYLQLVGKNIVIQGFWNWNKIIRLASPALDPTPQAR